MTTSTTRTAGDNDERKKNENEANNSINNDNNDEDDDNIGNNKYNNIASLTRLDSDKQITAEYDFFSHSSEITEFLPTFLEFLTFVSTQE